MESWGGSFLVTELISNGWLSPDQKTGLNGYKYYLDACSGEVSIKLFFFLIASQPDYRSTSNRSSSFHLSHSSPMAST